MRRLQCCRAQHSDVLLITLCLVHATESCVPVVCPWVPGRPLTFWTTRMSSWSMRAGPGRAWISACLPRGRGTSKRSAWWGTRGRYVSVFFFFFLFCAFTVCSESHVCARAYFVRHLYSVRSAVRIVLERCVHYPWCTSQHLILNSIARASGSGGDCWLTDVLPLFCVLCLVTCDQ